ncbi:hypothetical protein DL546_004703 [Coniochaeta pulveracea]|uniref:Uncharacterized protein n=1 Tax=Coniochaeta pulveracea TaxID=177199 RepID=A0A420Y3K2_9PEZI|nr:hypothetical protein DL546_004703 [Coniochaeta pulveracea]
MSIMPLSYGFGVLPPGTYSNDDRLMGELSRQLSAVQHHDRYMQKGTSSARHNNNPMRITKPRSANHSPCSYSTRLQQGWTRTNAVENQHQPLPMQVQSTARAPRPLSWHPSSSQFAQPLSSEMFGQSQPQAYYQSPMGQYAASNYVGPGLYASTQDAAPSSPPVYSGYTSPASAFSPMPLSYTSYDQHIPTQPYFTQASWAAPPELSPAMPVAESPLDSYLRSSIPPTPDSYFYAPQPKVQSEDSIPYQSLEGEEQEEEEEEGEILYGMGLYDAPKEPLQSLLCGGVPAGKGLTLEAAWAPPVSDDEDDAEGDGQQVD